MKMISNKNSKQKYGLLSSKVSSKVISKGFTMTGLMALVMFSSQASAAEPSQCQGLESDACITATTCSWVNGYERQDGRKVSSFCRTKAAPKSAASTSSSESAIELPLKSPSASVTNN